MSLRLASAFFARDAVTVARGLLGCSLVRVLADGRRVAGRIVETEAYIGPEDLGSHASGDGGGRRTRRTEPMFGPPGLSYVYFTYGMHFCMNVSVLRRDHPAAVLLRALEPLEGLEAMRELRGPSAVKDLDLCRGPARLCRALSIGPSENAVDTLTSTALWFERGPGIREGELETSSARIGLGDKGQWTGRPLRFYLQGCRFVSGPRGL